MSSAALFCSFCHAEDDEDEAPKAVSKKCQSYQKMLDALAEKGQTAKKEAYRKLLTAKSKKDETRIITEFNKVDEDIARKISQLGVNPKYKDCDGNLSEIVGIKGN